MARDKRARRLARRAERIPGLRRLPAVRLLALAEVALMLGDHLSRLSPSERRRLVELVGASRGRRGKLSGSERRELAKLLEKLEPRRLAGRTFEALSPVPLPQRILYGRRGRG